MLNSTAEPILTTVDPVAEPRATTADIVSPDDFFAKCSPAFPPELVLGASVKGEPVYVARLNVAGLGDYFKEIDGAADSEFRGAVLAACLVRANGTRIFHPTHRLQMSQYPADESQLIIGTFYEVNGLGARKK